MRRRPRGWSFALALAAPASAATVMIRPHPEPVYGAEVALIAAPGERNRVVLEEEPGRFTDPSHSGGVWVVRDSGAVLTPAGEGCESVH